MTGCLVPMGDSLPNKGPIDFKIQGKKHRLYPIPDEYFITDPTQLQKLTTKREANLADSYSMLGSWETLHHQYNHASMHAESGFDGRVGHRKICRQRAKEVFLQLLCACQICGQAIQYQVHKGTHKDPVPCGSRPGDKSPRVVSWLQALLDYHTDYFWVYLLRNRG